MWSLDTVDAFLFAASRACCSPLARFFQFQVLFFFFFFFLELYLEKVRMLPEMFEVVEYQFKCFNSADVTDRNSRTALVCYAKLNSSGNWTKIFIRVEFVTQFLFSYFVLRFWREGYLDVVCPLDLTILWYMRDETLHYQWLRQIGSLIHIWTL